MRILAAATDQAWVGRVIAEIDGILVDHAHCEKKAASTALGLFRYPERSGLLVPLARLAQEELAHFAEVAAVLAERGVALRHQVPSPYAAALLAAVRATEPARLVTRCSARRSSRRGAASACGFWPMPSRTRGSRRSTAGCCAPRRGIT